MTFSGKAGYFVLGAFLAFILLGTQYPQLFSWLFQFFYNGPK